MEDLLTHLLQFLGQLTHTSCSGSRSVHSGSPRVIGSTSRSTSSHSRASLLTALLRPPPILPIRPSPTRSPSCSSLIPALITCCLILVSRETTEIPYPAYRHGLVGCEQAPCPFIKFAGYSLVSALDLFFSFHAAQSIIYCLILQTLFSDDS